MKVLLTAVNSQFIHSNLAVRYLKAYAKDVEHECLIREFTINDRMERVVEEIISEKPDIVAFSCYIWNIEFITRMSTVIKLIDDKIKILYGGPEVTYDSEEFLRAACGDFVIQGEGEETFREFLTSASQPDFEEKAKDIKGLYSKINNKIFFGGKRELMNMEDVAFPYEPEENLENKIVYYEASRGCPFNCKYCLSSTIHGVRFLPIARVKRELKYFMDKKVELIKFVDRTFNCNHEFAYEIWSFLKENECSTAFHFEISADLLNDKELKLLAEVPEGKFQFEVGVQTTNEQVLKNINRNVNFSDIREKVVELESVKNIKQHLDLIAGLPGEDFESFRKSFNDVYNARPEEIQLGFLKILKGSLMEEEAKEFGIVSSPYPPYEVLRTNHISYYQLGLLKRVEKMVDKYYNSHKFSNIVEYFVKMFDTPFDFFEALGNFFNSKGYFGRNISNTDYYKVFIEFNELIDGNAEVAANLIKFDFLSFNGKKYLPDFITHRMNKNDQKNIKEKLNDIGEKLDATAFIEKFEFDVLDFKNKELHENEECFYIFEKEGKFRKIKF